MILRVQQIQVKGEQSPDQTTKPNNGQKGRVLSVSSRLYFISLATAQDE